MTSRKCLKFRHLSLLSLLSRWKSGTCFSGIIKKTSLRNLLKLLGQFSSLRTVNKVYKNSSSGKNTHPTWSVEAEGLVLGIFAGRRVSAKMG